MNRRIALTTLVVADYDEAIAWYTGKLGFALLEDIDQRHKRWVVVGPTDGSAAAKAGLAAGDLVTGVNGATVDSADALVAQVRAIKPGTTLELTLVRDGTKKTVKVTLAA